MAKQIVEMEIEKVIMELPDTKSIRLKWPDGYNPDFKTGQFITLYWPDTPSYKRAYSLSSCALDRGFFETTVKRDGKMGTRIVDWAKPGDRMFVIPPTGKFLPVYEPNQHLVCLAGGSGVTPFRAFVREATKRKLETNCQLSPRRAVCTVEGGTECGEHLAKLLSGFLIKQVGDEGFRVNRLTRNGK